MTHGFLWWTGTQMPAETSRCLVDPGRNSMGTTIEMNPEVCACWGFRGKYMAVGRGQRCEPMGLDPLI